MAKKSDLHTKRPSLAARALARSDPATLRSLGLRPHVRHSVRSPYSKDGKSSKQEDSTGKQAHGAPSSTASRPTSPQRKLKASESVEIPASTQKPTSTSTITTSNGSSLESEIPPVLAKETLRTLMKLVAPLGQFRDGRKQLQTLRTKLEMTRKKGNGKLGKQQDSSSTAAADAETDINSPNYKVEKDPLVLDPKLSPIDRAMLKKKLFVKHKRLIAGKSNDSGAKKPEDKPAQTLGGVEQLESDIKTLDMETIPRLQVKTKELNSNLIFGMNEMTRKLERLLQYFAHGINNTKSWKWADDIFEGKLSLVVFTFPEDLDAGLRTVLAHLEPLIAACNKVILQQRDKFPDLVKEINERKLSKHSIQLLNNKHVPILICRLGKGSTKRLLNSSKMRKILAITMMVNRISTKTPNNSSTQKNQKTTEPIDDWSYTGLSSELFETVSEEIPQPSTPWIHHVDTLQVMKHKTIISTMPLSTRKSKK